MSKKFLRTIGENIRNARSWRYKSTVAIEAGINPSQWTKIERGEIDFRITTLENIAKTLGVDPSTLMTNDQKKDDSN